MSERKGTKALELWCKRLVKDCPNVQIDNMTTSWRNGIAFCALVHHFRPDLIDMSKLKPENIYENNQLAFSVAEKHLGIPALLDAEDMVENDVPDRLSILTYLSQFYQRLGHTVNTKVTENESKSSMSQAASAQPMAPISFGKTGLDKCTACGLPVYLAQRLLVSHKLYHRRCFRCSKCSGHLNPKNYHVVEGSEFCCDSCKNEKTMSKLFNNNAHDQMGMLAFNDTRDTSLGLSHEEPVSRIQKPRPQSILEKINMFEKNIDKDPNIESKVMNLTIKDNVSIRNKELSSITGRQIESDPNIVLTEHKTLTKLEDEVKLVNNLPEKQYKSNIEKFNFLQTQLTGSDMDVSNNSENAAEGESKHNTEVCTSNGATSIDPIEVKVIDTSGDILKTDSNITDDSRLAKNNNPTASQAFCEETPQIIDEEIKICVPPRRKKHNTSQNSAKKPDVVSKPKKEYPVHLNPFSDDDEEDVHKDAPKKSSTNPFGSSDEEDDQVPPIPIVQLPSQENTTPVKRLIAVNPFWSDGEEPSSDEETYNSSSKMYKSPITASTPNLPSSTPRRKKAKAPAPPILSVTASPRLDPATSMDDVASISSLSSYNSTVHSDQKSFGRATPLLMKRVVPAPDSVSTVSGDDGSLDKSVDTSPLPHNTSLEGRRAKGPAPGLPLPSRRRVRLQLAPEQLQVQLDLLETQQLGLERQGVLIERIIRDKCEGDEANSVPQEEVEDLVIQLCELVNEKNDLFRKQTELMYIRRQQRLEQEQADIEHEIRIIQSRPAVNRIDADKAREEQLVTRLVEIVRMRDELVQQLDAERRRERQEDLAIAASIATKRAQRNSESNSSSIKSLDVTPKKSKVKDKVKKQLKKAKHTLIPKKKDDTADRKEDKPDKEKISK